MDPVTEAAEPVIADNPQESRFEILVGGERAGLARYQLRGQVLSLTHTEVDPRFQGLGLASKLARAVLDQARERGLAVLPYCPYTRSWIARHPEYTDLVPAGRRPEFRL
ncbi:MAG TPA: GNAT family N-acetyltransferase [Trebonia sp.]|nr:GNAT family N-acetyltransferase [Trebonia sp.]